MGEPRGLGRTQVFPNSCKNSPFSPTQVGCDLYFEAQLLKDCAADVYYRHIIQTRDAQRGFMDCCWGSTKKAGIPVCFCCCRIASLDYQDQHPSCLKARCNKAVGAAVIQKEEPDKRDAAAFQREGSTVKCSVMDNCADPVGKENGCEGYQSLVHWPWGVAGM